MARTPLAWCNLTHDRVRFALFVLGIVFAVVLMFVQVGIRGALLDSNTLLHEHLNADLVLVSPSRQMVSMRESFSKHRLTQAAAVPGVRDTVPLYLDNTLGQLRDTHPDARSREPSRSIRVIGIPPQAHALKLPELDPTDERYLGKRLQEPGTAIYDRKTKRKPAGADEGPPTGDPDFILSVFGPMARDRSSELAGQTITFTGSFAIGPDFTSDGTLIMSAESFGAILRRPYTMGDPLADVDLGLIRLEPGADLEQVRAAILRAVTAGGSGDPDVDVVTVSELMDREQTFWKTNTPIGFTFGFGMFMGFVVGLVICYQILSGDVADHLPEYATLKAVGYRNWYLGWIVVQEALILAVVGYVVGLGLSWAAYEGLTYSTGMPLRMTPERAVLVLVATLFMCVVSAMIALVKLLRADPADVF